MFFFYIINKHIIHYFSLIANAFSSFIFVIEEYCDGTESSNIWYYKDLSKHAHRSVLKNNEVDKFFEFCLLSRAKLSNALVSYKKYGYHLIWPELSSTMRFLVFCAFVFGCWGNINVIVYTKGGFNITVNGTVWLRSSRTALYAYNKWYSCDDNSLPFTGITTGQ